MAKVDDPTRMGHMLEAAEKAIRFGKGKQRADLERDEVLCLALVRLCEIIGEAASRVSQKARSMHPQIPWPQITGMRNRLVHGYDEIDLDVLTQTIAQDLQPLIVELKRIGGPPKQQE